MDVDHSFALCNERWFTPYNTVLDFTPLHASTIHHQRASNISARDLLDAH